MRPKYSNLEFVKDLWHFFRFHKRKFIFWSFILILANVGGLIPPIIIAKLIDFFTEGGSSLKTFYTYLGILLGLEVVIIISRLRSKYNLGLLRNEIETYVKVASFQKILQGDLVWHDKENTGNKMQRVNEGGRAIKDFMGFYNNQGISAFVSVIGVIIIFGFFNIKYSIIALLFMFTYLTSEFIINRRVAQKALTIRIKSEKAIGKAYEFSSNIQTVKSMGMEDASKKQIANYEKDLLKAKDDKMRTNNLKWIINQIISAFFFIVFLFFVGNDVLGGALTVGAIIIYVTYIGRLRTVMNMVSSESSRLIDVKYGLYRMMEIYKVVPDINEEGAKNLKEWNEIKIENVGFKYKEEGVLDDFSLKIKKGEKIGIVGKSGCGKSTLFKLLLKLYLPQRGMIYFDRKPINTIKRDSITDKISIVPQETEVFNLSLRENITISGNGRINPPRYKKAINVSQLSKVISKLRKKDLSLIGEKGVRLSGGERQRLGIARAVYKDSDIIIFDEATSNLDYATEKDVQKEMDKLEGKTVIISAHRLSTLKNMDKILVMAKGKIIEQGTYEGLLEKKGWFYKIWEKQEVGKK
ncbi:ABC transporter ATP-binding protein [Candidatus Pacearchaeota archaeon]|nr:ABC transporter ATP-binding protein [Candidatus Pacearchaeota archaeon]